MKTRLYSALALAAMTVVVAAFPAFATHDGSTVPAGCRMIRGMETKENHDDDVIVCRQDVWFHKAQERIANLAGQGHDTFPSWNTTAPTGTLQDAGAVHLNQSAYDIFVAKDGTGRAIFRGSFTGVLDTLAFRVHLRAPIQEATGTAWPAVLVLKIDGQVLHDNFDGDAIPMTLKVAGDMRRIDGVYTNLYDAMENSEMDLSPTKVHEVEVEFVPWTFGDSHTAIFFDAAPAASGLIFNLPPTNMSGYTQFNLAPSE